MFFDDVLSKEAIPSTGGGHKIKSKVIQQKHDAINTLPHQLINKI